MHELILLIQNTVRMIWRFRWVALLTSIGICVLGWLFVLTLPNVYEVEAKIFLDSQTLLRPVLKDIVVDTDRGQQTALMMKRTLLVRPNLEAVARKTDMDLGASTPEEFEALLDKLATKVKLEGTVKDNIFVIGYAHQNPKLATRVVESLLNVFVEKTLGESRKDTSKTKAFLAKQISEYEARLQAAEQRLKDFKQRNVGLMEGDNYFARLEQLGQQLSDARLERRQAERRRDSLQRQLSATDEFYSLDLPAGPDLGPSHPLDGRIQSLESQLDQLLLQFTDRHPDILSTRRVLQELRTQRDTEIANQPVGGEDETGGLFGGQRLQNPVFQQLQATFTEADAQVASIEALVEELESRQQNLREAIDTSLNVEAELKRLDRDYEVNRANYEELVKRREVLNISDDVTQETNDVTFNVIEPPREPLVPKGPNRLLFAAMVLAAGIATGAGLAWLLAMFRPAIYSKEGFAEFSDLPVLGTVSRIWTPKEQVSRRMEVTSFAVGCLGLLALFVGLAVLDYTDNDLLSRMRNVDIEQQISQLREKFL